MYSEAERRIYRTTIEGRPAAFDPMVLRRRMAEAQQSLGLNLFEMMESYRTIHEAGLTAEANGQALPPSLQQEQLDVMERVAKIADATFDVPPMDRDGSGWTVEEAVLTIVDYINWEADLRGKPGASPSRSTSSGGPPGDSAPAGPAGQAPPSDTRTSSA